MERRASVPRARRARDGGDGGDGLGARRAALRARGRLRDALRRLRDDRGGHGRCARSSARTAGCWPSSRRAPSTRRAAARCPTAALVETPSGRARVVDVFRLGDDQALALEPIEGEIGAGRARHARWSSAPTRARHDAQPHRHPPAARRAARAARHARPPGRLVRGARQAALRLHPRRAALAPRSCADVEARVNGWIADSHAGARDRDDARRGRGARRDGAVRREVRRLGADGRGRRASRASCAAARTRGPPRPRSASSIMTAQHGA